MSVLKSDDIIRALLIQSNFAQAIDCPIAIAHRLIEHGLGPIAYAACESGLLTVTAETKQALLAADLTARAISAANQSALVDVLHKLNSDGIEPLLLKGIALAMRYPKPHWRLMSDIDLLVPPPQLEATMVLLRELGFSNGYEKPASHWSDHHHAEPLRHPDSGLWIEVHRALHSSALFEPNLFDTDRWDQDTQALDYCSAKVRILEPRLQLHHCAAHWYLNLVEDLGVSGIVRALFDAEVLIGGDPLDTQWLPTQRSHRFATLTLVGVLLQLGVINANEDIKNELKTKNQVTATQMALQQSTRLSIPSQAFAQQLFGKWFELLLDPKPLTRRRKIAATLPLLCRSITSRLGLSSID